MYACFSNASNWDEQCLGFIGMVKYEAVVNKGVDGAIRSFLANESSADFSEPEFVIHKYDDTAEAYQDMLDDNEFSCYFSATPSFYVVFPGGDCVDTVYVFARVVLTSVPV